MANEMGGNGGVQPVAVGGDMEAQNQEDLYQQQ